MPNDNTPNDNTPAPAAGNNDLAALLEKPAPKGEGGAPPVEGSGMPEAGARGSSTSSSSTDDSLDTALDRVAKIERANALKQQELDRKLKEADDARTAAETSKKQYDEGLAKQARLVLADEKRTKGEKMAAIKEFMADAWNPQEFMELVALEFPAGDGEAPPEKPVADQITAALEARDKKKAEEAEEARKAAEAKKAEDDKNKDDVERTAKVDRWKDEAVKSIDEDAHPKLKEKLDAWTEDFGAEKAKEMMRERLMTTFVETYTDHARALDPDEAAALLEMKFAKKAAPPKRTPMEMIEAEADAIDEGRRERERANRTVSRTDTSPKKKPREEMTALDLIGEEADELDRRRGQGRIYETEY
jgi:hypothetical protein